MRHECMLLLRERFHLEQCVRYLAVRSHFPVPGKGKSIAQGSSDSRSPLEKNPVQPASLRRHHLYATPVSRRSLMLAGRGKQALQEGQAWQSKVLFTCAARSFMRTYILELIWLLAHSLTPLFIARSLTHSLTHSLIRSLTHPLTQSIHCLRFGHSHIVRQDKVLNKHNNRSHSSLG